jgi:hypothetical protein
LGEGGCVKGEGKVKDIRRKGLGEGKSGRRNG